MKKFLLMALFFIGWANAATMPTNFNTVTVPVQSQAATDLHSALTNAFLQALIKITGNSQIISLPEVTQQLPSIEKLVQKYSYQGGGIQVTFDQHALITFLIQLQQPIWLTERPKTLIWLSVNGQTPIAATAVSNSLLALLQANADRRGASIRLPIMDESDQKVWQAKLAGTPIDQLVLEKIAEHYQSPAILSGELTPANGGWSANWFLVWHGQTWQWHNEGPETVILPAVIDKLTDLMAGQLAVRLDGSSANNLWLAIMGIDNLADYNSVLTLLKGLQPVLGVMVQDVGSHGLLLQMTTVGQGEGPLKEALAATDHFTAITADDQGSDNVLNYKWNP